MRVKVGPTEWRDLGPGAAVGGRGGVSDRAVGGRAVGQMMADAPTGATPLRAGSRFRSANPLGIKTRRPREA